MFVNQAERPSGNAVRQQGPSVTGSPSALTNASQRSLAKTDLEMQTGSGFWSIYLPYEDPALDGSIGGVLSAPWIPTVRALAEEDSYLRTAVNACAFAGLGWIREDYALVQHGTRLYAQALRETNTALQDPVRVQSDYVLACCRVLSLFEMFRRSAPGDGSRSQVLDWQSHVDGTCRIVQLRGPERHVSGHGLNLYDGVRMTAIIHGLARRQPNAFTSLPWGLPQDRNMRDELFDLVGTVPELFQRIDCFMASITQPRIEDDRNETLRQGWELLNRCVTTGDKLCQWETKALDLCRKSKSLQNPNSSEAITGASLDQASLLDVCKAHGDGFFFVCTQYWAVCTKLYSSIRLLYQRTLSLTETASSSDPVPQLPPWVEPESHALNIACTATHFFRPEAGLWSAQSAVFPIGTALFYFARTNRRESAPFKMMTDAFKDNKAGSVMRDFLHNVVNAK